MSANVESMVSANDITPWHHEGTVIKGALSFEEGWKLSGHDFEVEKVQLHTPEGDAVPNVYGTRRTDTGQILTKCKVVSEKWEPMQNATAWKVFQPLIDSGEVSLETAGVLDGGRKVWILGCLNRHQSAEVVPGDEVKNYILFANGHDGSLSITIGGTRVRVVCQNTLAASQDEGQMLKFRHVGDQTAHIANAAELIAELGQSFRADIAKFQAMSKAKIKSGKQVADYAAAVWGREEKESQKEGKVSRKLATLFEKFEGGVGQDIPGAKGTAWGLYNALTEYESHRGRSNDLDGLAFGSRGKKIRRGMDAAMVIAKDIPLEDVFGEFDDVMVTVRAQVAENNEKMRVGAA